MADPTLQTFCCVQSSSQMGLDELLHFNSEKYSVVCIISALIGLTGAIYQILPREMPLPYHRPVSFSSTRGRQIILWLAVADLLASIAVLVRSVLWIIDKQSMDKRRGDIIDTLLCAVSSGWIQYFYTSTWLWTLCYAVDVKRMLQDKEGKPWVYHTICWGIPAILTFSGLLILYFPNLNCHAKGAVTVYHILPNFCATYMSIALVMVACPVLYCQASSAVKELLTRNRGRFTSQERWLVDSLKVKFFCISLVFYVCWVPNLINGILLWTLWLNVPQNIIMTVWYVMAVLNPLQAMLNCLVYRSWGTEVKIRVPWRRTIPPAVESFDPSHAHFINKYDVQCNDEMYDAWYYDDDSNLLVSSETTPLLNADALQLNGVLRTYSNSHNYYDGFVY